MNRHLSFLRYLAGHPAARGRRARTILRALTWRATRAVGLAPLDLTLRPGLRLRIDPTLVSARMAYYLYGRQDHQEIALLEHYLRPGDTFLDVGASLGLYTLHAAALVGAAGRVHAFEPGDRSAARLQENLDLNHLAQVTLHRSAVGATTGQVTLTGADELARMDPSGRSAGVTVPCLRLDELDLPGGAALAKVDVEGAEPLVLQGAARLLREATPPLWILEVNGLLHGFGWTEVGLAEWLQEQGYLLGLYEPETRRFRFSEQPWRERANVVAVASARLDEVLRRLAEAPRG